MTDILILPGFSLKNKDWANQMANEMQPQFEAKMWEWKHWESGESADFSAELEAKAIITQLEKHSNKPINVLAKSIGTYVLANIVKHSPASFSKIILCGIPLNDLKSEEWTIYENFKNVNSRTICFQNDQDPHGNFAQVSKFFEEKDINIPVVKKVANNHDYCYCEEFKSFLA